MEKFKLKNGITVIFEKTSSKSVTVEVMFKVGSNHESKNIAGISHFLEHMIFEGTKKRNDSRIIANEIEKFGGEFNAYTSGDRTAFFIKIINKRIDIALDILSDIISDPLFEERKIKKEKQVVLKEINMITDDPKQHQWILFQKKLFDKHPAKNPTYGTVKSVKNLSRNTVLNYYNNHYVSNNMIISIVGNVSDINKKIIKYFSKLKSRKVKSRKRIIEYQQKNPKTYVEKRKIQNSYMVLGYKTVPRLHPDSYVFDVITAILGKPQSGWVFDEIRNKRGLAYQAAVQNESEKDYGEIAIFAGLDKTFIEEAKKVILQLFRKLENLDQKELIDAKTYIEGNHTLELEDNLQAADNLASWETIKDASLSKTYIKRIKRVTKKDIKRVSKKYLNENYTLVVIRQK